MGLYVSVKPKLKAPSESNGLDCVVFKLRSCVVVSVSLKWDDKQITELHFYMCFHWEKSAQRRGSRKTVEWAHWKVSCDFVLECWFVPPITLAWRFWLPTVNSFPQLQRIDCKRKVAADAEHLAHRSIRRLPHLLRIIVTPSPIHRRTGYCFRSICLFVCLFVSFLVSLLARLRENGWTDLHEIFREGVERPWDDLIQVWVNSEKPRCRDAQHGAGFVVISHQSLFVIVPMFVYRTHGE